MYKNYVVVKIYRLCGRLRCLRQQDIGQEVLSCEKLIQFYNWIKRDQLDVTCFIISLLNAQHVSDVNTSILRSLRLICWVISWVVLLWFDVCWCYVVVWLGWCGIRMRASCFIISLFNAQHVSDVNTSIFRSLQIICWVISWVVLLWFDVCWCYVMVCLWWCGIPMRAESLVH